MRHFLPCAKLFATMRPGRTWPPLIDSAPALQMQEPKKNLVRAAAEPCGQHSQRVSFSVSDLFLARVGQSPWSLEITFGVGPDLALSKHAPYFVKSTVTLGDALFTMKISHISRATLDSERHWTPPDLGTGSIVWAPKRPRGYCGVQSSAYPPATIQESIGKVGTLNARV